ncbi:SLATT domain-containing protein [Paraburkholderia sp. Tr-20389]|uniref:SLATT domain-containing protein n=1 Tax=Paraburkholderia sp. Tr-20389 TaxID=2703903 RepID=UPI00197F16C1|nr:SLATT domain-containing protein [Paraburkholderia sp. Tr-20389]MBN3755537.1 SLATT domain-containing protein [Paraburkholderia sp. Tr-20389]
MTMLDTDAQARAAAGSRSDAAAGVQSEYRPPANENELLLKWIRRARESQKSHYDMADLLAARNRLFGIGVTVLSAVVGTTVFLSLVVSEDSPWGRLVVGLVSIAAAASAALQTFLRYAERAEAHRAAGARYGAVRRRLEAIYAGDPGARDGRYVSEVREMLDRLAEDAPSVPPRVFRRTQHTLRDAALHGRDENRWE